MFEIANEKFLRVSRCSETEIYWYLREILVIFLQQVGQDENGILSSVQTDVFSKIKFCPHDVFTLTTASSSIERSQTHVSSVFGFSVSRSFISIDITCRRSDPEHFVDRNAESVGDLEQFGDRRQRSAAFIIHDRCHGDAESCSELCF